ncbi:MAG: GHKL domain-containing protein [Nitrospirae bacterium]|nr:GHKL domain-containing protein [Nitrospirota bacterium]
MRERGERALLAFVLITAFAAVTFYISQRIQRLTRRVEDFSQHTFGARQQEIQRGDQLHVLEERFQHLTEEVVRSHEIIKKQAEEQVREKEAKIIQAKLIHANKMTSLGTLVSGVAHEINNPNSFIMSNAQLFNDIWKDIFLLLEEHYRKNGDFPIGNMMFSEIQSLVPRLLNTITKGTERIKNIVDSLKNFARADTGNLDEKVDVNKVVETAIFFLNAEIRKFTDNFHVACKDNVPFVRGSSRQLEQVVINLLMNALQALDNRERGIWISTSQDEIAGSVLIKIKDEGCGIQKEILDRITEPFFTTKLNQGGTGLGLSISYAIVKEHKGSMEFTSEPGKGTIACITLPVYDRLIGQT